MPILARLALGLCLLLPLAAQTEPEKPDPKKSDRFVRFLPVGDPPPFEQEIRDGIAYEKPAPPGSVPPHEVQLGSDKETPQTATLQLGQITEPMKVPGGPGSLNLRRKADGAESEPWLKVDRPEDGNFIVVLWRDPVKKSWEATRSVVLPENPTDAPAGSVRFVNVSPVEVGLIYGDEQLALKAGTRLLRLVNVGTDTPFELGAMATTGRLKRFFSGTVFQNPNERSFVIMYLADGVAPRLPLKAYVLRETVPTAPVAPAAPPAAKAPRSR